MKDFILGVYGIEKRAITTGPLGYLTAPAYSPIRASEVKGGLKAVDEDPDSMYINRPVLSHLIGQLIGTAAGGAVGAGLGTALDTPGGGLAGGVGGAYTGLGLSTAFNVMAQQRAVARNLKKLRETNPEAYERLKKRYHKKD